MLFVLSAIAALYQSAPVNAPDCTVRSWSVRVSEAGLDEEGRRELADAGRFARSMEADVLMVVVPNQEDKGESMGRERSAVVAEELRRYGFDDRYVVLPVEPPSGEDWNVQLMIRPAACVAQ